MPMRFSHAHDVHLTLTRFFYANVRGLRERIESRRRFAEDGIDSRRRKKNKLATKLKEKANEQADEEDSEQKTERQGGNRLR
jgi:predicted DNA-binding protein (UPF0278 family)